MPEGEGRSGGSRLSRRLGGLKGEGRKALIIYLCAGDPDLESTFALVRALEGLADVIELGVPYSDPLADGPVIQAASQRALAAGVTPRDCIALVSRLREAGCETPIVLMGYYNPLLARGLAGWVDDCARAGVDGLIIPDLPHEESDDLRDACVDRGIDLIPLLAPTSPAARIETIARGASGFIYCVSLTGVTGARAALSDRFAGLVRMVKEHTSIPVAVGFGVSTAEHVRQVTAVADAAIVGSAVVRICGEEKDRARLLERVVELVRSLRTGLE